MGNWSFIVYTFLTICGISVGIINVSVIFFILYFASKIRQYINRYFFIFARYGLIGVLLGSFIGAALGHLFLGMDTEMAESFFSNMIFETIFSELIGVILVSPTFIVLSLIIYYKNKNAISMPSSKQRSAKIGFLFFSILSFFNVFIPFAIFNIILDR